MTTTALTARPWIAERTAEINASADAITALNIGDGVSVSVWSDVDAYTIVKKTATTITLRADTATLLNRDELRFIPGGFAAHCSNQRDQRWTITSDTSNKVIRIRLGKTGWKDAHGRKFKLSEQPHKFFDYNF
jgi:hypothetical protein